MAKLTIPHTERRAGGQIELPELRWKALTPETQLAFDKMSSVEAKRREKPQ